MATPAIHSVLNFLDWNPATQAQKLALHSSSQFDLMGGAAGSLKSETCLLDAIWRTADNPRGKSIIFRRTFPELEELIARSREIYSQCGATYKEQPKTWTFPSGMTVKFRQVERDKDIFRFQGHQYDFIGWDEATHFLEFPIRYMTSRLRSTDPSLQDNLRIRLYSNPGAGGHAFIKKIFMGKGCSHCKLGQTGVLEPWREYHNRVWPSDNRKIPFSTKFIPGRLTDHTLLGERYKEQLRGLSAVYAKALEEGCWDLFVGQFFDCWNRERMVVTRQKIENRHWWPTWVGCDYGFSGSSAYAVLLTKDSAGVIYAIDEILEKHMKASEFAKAIRDRWVKGDIRPSPYYLSPDAWNDRTDAHTIADQMLDASGLMFEKASNDRVGGAMLMYEMLDGDKFKIADTCPQLIEAIPSRVHDMEKNPNDVLKVKEAPEDDVYDGCLVPETLVTTLRGDIPLIDVTISDHVLTRAGWKRVLRSWKTKDNAQLFTIEMSDGTRLTGTGNHPVWADNIGDFIRLDSLRYGDNTLRTASAPVHVVRVITGKRGAVYNLEVEGQPEYFANGVLVHNCRYGLYSYIRSARKPDSVLLEEAVAHIDDPTQAMIHRKKVEQELNKKTDVVSYRGSQPWRFGR